MSREGDEQSSEGPTRPTARYTSIRIPPGASDLEKAAAKLWDEAAKELISDGRCPVHPHQRLTDLSVGHSALGGGTCADCDGSWSYSPRVGVNFRGPTPVLRGVVWDSAIRERPVCTPGSNGFGPYFAAETICQVIDLAELLDNTPFAADDAVEAGKKVLHTAETGMRILIIAAAMALGRRLGSGR